MKWDWNNPIKNPPPADKEVLCRIGFKDMAMIDYFREKVPSGTFVLDPHGGLCHSWFFYNACVHADGKWKYDFIPWWWKDIQNDKNAS